MRTTALLLAFLAVPAAAAELETGAVQAQAIVKEAKDQRTLAKVKRQIERLKKEQRSANNLSNWILATCSNAQNCRNICGMAREAVDGWTNSLEREIDFLEDLALDLTPAP